MSLTCPSRWLTKAIFLPSGEYAGRYRRQGCRSTACAPCRRVSWYRSGGTHSLTEIRRLYGHFVPGKRPGPVPLPRASPPRKPRAEPPPSLWQFRERFVPSSPPFLYRSGGGRMVMDPSPLRNGGIIDCHCRWRTFQEDAASGGFFFHALGCIKPIVLPARSYLRASTGVGAQGC